MPMSSMPTISSSSIDPRDAARRRSASAATLPRTTLTNSAPSHHRDPSSSAAPASTAASSAKREGLPASRVSVALNWARARCDTSSASRPTSRTVLEMCEGEHADAPHEHVRVGESGEHRRGRQVQHPQLAGDAQYAQAVHAAREQGRALRHARDEHRQVDRAGRRVGRSGCRKYGGHGRPQVTGGRAPGSYPRPRFRDHVVRCGSPRQVVRCWWTGSSPPRSDAGWRGQEHRPDFATDPGSDHDRCEHRRHGVLHVVEPWERTQERRHLDYRRIQPAPGMHRLDRITTPVVEAWLYALLERDGNRRCVQAAYETLRELLEQASRQRLLHANVAKAVRYPDQHMQRDPSPDQSSGNSSPTPHGAQSSSMTTARPRSHRTCSAHPEPASPSPQESRDTSPSTNSDTHTSAVPWGPASASARRAVRSPCCTRRTLTDRSHRTGSWW